jgi:polysaccharide export outer membrane protein
MPPISINKKKIITFLMSSILVGCASPIPSNYLSPLTVQTPQPGYKHWIHPRLIPVNAKTLASPQGQALLTPAMCPQTYRIGPYDSLNIIVWGHPEISTIGSAPIPVGNLGATALSTATNPTIIVQNDGTIFFPYVNRLTVAGLTVSQVEKQITCKLSRYIRNPQVSVQISGYRNRNIYVLGEVKNPGQQAITDKPLTLLSAISAAGNIDPSNADPHHIYVIRGDYQQPDVFWFSAKTPQALLIATRFPLQENDIVFVSSAEFSNLNRMLNQILPPLTAYTILVKV